MNELRRLRGSLELKQSDVAVLEPESQQTETRIQRRCSRHIFVSRIDSTISTCTDPGIVATNDVRGTIG